MLVAKFETNLPLLKLLQPLSIEFVIIPATWFTNLICFVLNFKMNDMVKVYMKVRLITVYANDLKNIKM